MQMKAIVIAASVILFFSAWYVWRHYLDPVGVALDYFEAHK